MIARSQLATKYLVWAALFSGVALIGAACGGGSTDTGVTDQQAISGIGAAVDNSTPVSVAGVTVQIADNTFTPPTVSVKQGGTITWKWSGSNAHVVLVAGAKSPEMTGSGTWDRTFQDPPGTVINYQCAIHGAAMSGKITIE